MAAIEARAMRAGRKTEFVTQIGTHLYRIALRVGATAAGIFLLGEVQEIFKDHPDQVRLGATEKVTKLQVKVDNDLIMSSENFQSADALQNTIEIAAKKMEEAAKADRVSLTLLPDRSYCLSIG